MIFWNIFSSCYAIALRHDWPIDKSATRMMDTRFSYPVKSIIIMVDLRSANWFVAYAPFLLDFMTFQPRIPSFYNLTITNLK